MFEFILWIGFGALTGWIAALATRTDDYRSRKPYVSIGVVGSICGGLIGRGLGMSPFSGTLAINPSSLMTAWFVSVACVVALSFFGRTSPNE